MVLLNKLNDTDDNIAFNSMPDGSASSDEGTMKEPLVIESEIPMAIGSSGAHETTTSTQQMPTNVVGQPSLIPDFSNNIIDQSLNSPFFAF
jgi:hypothetical protein